MFKYWLIVYKLYVNNTFNNKIQQCSCIIKNISKKSSIVNQTLYNIAIKYSNMLFK